MTFRSLAAALVLLAAPLARPADPAAEAAASYRIDTEGSTKAVAAGGKGTLVVAIVPIEKTHVHPQAPLKITLRSEGLQLEKTSLGHKDAVDPKAEGPRFQVPFVARKKGAQQVQANVDFFICSDKWCVKQVKDVTIPVKVQ
jgi:hypothetical protein